MKTVLITGTSRRLGLFLTTQFLQEEYQVIALTRQISPELAALSGANLHIMAVDYRDGAALNTAVTEIKARYQAINLLIHNASRFEPDSLHEADKWAFYDDLYAIHMRLPAFLNDTLQPCVAASGRGCIIHVTDIFVENPSKIFGLYCSTKAGLESLMKSYAKKFAPQIRVNSICPGPVLFLPHHTPAEKARVQERTLLPVEAGFEPILQGIKFIAENQFMTGASLKIDGGRSIG